ncbi:MAG: chalcone isomerase family protein [Aquabacterium sp.]|nr:chalcone isomerase family protein [Aquabacterium sp.]
MYSCKWMMHATRQMGVVAVLVALSGALGCPVAGCSVGKAAAATLEGQRFDDTMVLSDRTLRLNGLGLRGVAWIRAFVAGLYLAAPSKDVAQVLAMPGPKRLRLKIMLDAPSHELTKSLVGRIQDHEPPALIERLGERLPRLGGMIDSLGDLHPGDTIDLDFIPDIGVTLRYNDQVVGKPVAGDDLYRAVLKIFVGDHPVDRRLRDGLLRGGF